MKKILLLTLVSSLFLLLSNTNTTKAQEGSSLFTTDSKILQLGLGLGSTYTLSGNNTLIPPIRISYEQGFKDDIGPGVIGIGGYLGYSTSRTQKYNWLSSGEYWWTYSYIILGVRGNYHYQIVDKLDTYGGVMLGYNIATTKYHSSSNFDPGIDAASAGGLSWSLHFGANYYFKEKLGAFVELGYGIAYLQAGITLRM